MFGFLVSFRVFFKKGFSGFSVLNAIEIPNKACSLSGENLLQILYTLYICLLYDTMPS